jgi:hypothetical protein
VVEEVGVAGNARNTALTNATSSGAPVPTGDVTTTGAYGVDWRGSLGILSRRASPSRGS